MRKKKKNKLKNIEILTSPANCKYVGSFRKIPVYTSPEVPQGEMWTLNTKFEKIKDK